jgi:hypothetical protein
MVKSQPVEESYATPKASPTLISPPTAVWLGDNSGDLGFCWDRLRKLARIIHVDEAWTQGIDWSSIKPQLAFIGVGSRTPQLERLLETVQQHWPKAQRQQILSSWWNGHRRSYPLDESLDCAYWYQWWDVVLPTMTDQLQAARAVKKSKPMTRIERILARNPIASQTRTSRFSLVVTEGSTRRNLWSDGLGELGWHVVQVGQDSCNVDGRFDCVVLDIAGCSPALNERHTDEWAGRIEQTSRRFSDASILVVDKFPTRERWERFATAGADIILPSPFRWRGFQLLD